MPILNMIAQGSGGGGGNIGEPLNLTVTTSGLDATITWEDNEIGTIPPTTFQKSELVRKIGSAPTSPSDGVLVVTETVKDTYKVSGYVDQGLTDGETYYYRVFSYSDLGGISYCDAVNVTPSAGGWQPGAETLLYLPLETDVKDYSLNNRGTFTNIGTLGQKGGVNCWYCGRDGGIDITYNAYQYIVTADHKLTFNCWCIIDGGHSANQKFFEFAGIGTIGILCAYGTNNKLSYITVDSTNKGGSFDTALSTNTRYNVAFVIDNSSVTAYINGVKETTTYSSLSNYGFGCWDTRLPTNQQCMHIASCRGTTIGLDNESFNGGLSKIIFEDKAWTAQEVADYYNQTKADYGIS